MEPSAHSLASADHEAAAKRIDPEEHQAVLDAHAHAVHTAPAFLDRPENTLSYHTGDHIATAERAGEPLAWRAADTPGLPANVAAHARMSAEDEGCAVTINADHHDRSPELSRRALRHELSHCTLDNLLTPSEHHALHARIADAVPMTTLADEWFGAAQEGAGAGPHAGRATARDYAVMTAFGDPTQGALAHPETGALHVDATRSQTPHRSSNMWIEEAFTHLTTGTTPAPGASPPPDTSPDTAEGMKQWALALGADIKAVNAGEMTRDALRERYAELIDPSYQSIFTAEDRARLPDARQDPLAAYAHPASLRAALTRGTDWDMSKPENIEKALDRIGLRAGTHDARAAIERIAASPDAQAELVNDRWTLANSQSKHTQPNLEKKYRHREPLREHPRHRHAATDPREHALQRAALDHKRKLLEKRLKALDAYMDLEEPSQPPRSALAPPSAPARRGQTSLANAAANAERPQAQSRDEGLSR